MKAHWVACQYFFEQSKVKLIIEYIIVLFDIIKKARSLSQKSYCNLVKNQRISQKYTLPIFFTSLLVTAIIIGVKQWGGLENLELVAYDRIVRLKNDNRLDERLLLVEITDLDIKNQAHWPISDEKIAKLLAEIQKYQPKVIGLDLYRDIPFPPGTESLQEQLQADNIVVIEYLGHEENHVPPPEIVLPSQVGFNDIVLDRDSVLRRNLLYARSEERELYSFAFRMSLQYLQDLPGLENNLEITESLDSLTIGNIVLPRLQANSGGYQMHPTEALGWQILIDYQTRNIAQTITLTEILEGELNSDLVKDKVVIIGTTAPSIKDFFYVPYEENQGTMPGALAHAQMVSQIIRLILGESTPFWFWPEGLESLWIWVWSLVGLAIAIRWKHPLSNALATITAISLSYGIYLAIFFAGGWIPLIPSLLSLVLTVGLIWAYKVVYNTLYDSLTALPNSTLFTQQLKKLNRKYLPNDSSLSIVVFCLDLDRFKLINDGLGYQAGDQLLLANTKHLQDYLSSEKLLARVGGDEFAIAAVLKEDPAVAIEIANKLQKILTFPFHFNNREILNSVTIGIAIKDITPDFIAENILRSARTAMYKAKASGKIRYEIFAQKMHQQALMRLEFETDLYQAIEDREFQLYYQPIISLETHKIAGFEALVRWISPSKGFISPGEFIPIAEESGAIIPLGEWILQEACNQMYLWQQKFPEYCDLFISVNLSGRQFHQPNLVEKIAEILEMTQINYQNLKLEITESMVMDNVQDAIAMLQSLKALGLRLSMDDFGTGFSSFSYLHQFPMDTLKVDRSFVSNMNQGTKNLEIVSTIILLAHKLGMDVIAEGIETEEEQAILENLDCEYGQGYLYSKPLPADQVPDWLLSQP